MKHGNLSSYEGFITVRNFMKNFWVCFFLNEVIRVYELSRPFFVFSRCDLCKYGFLFYLYIGENCLLFEKLCQLQVANAKMYQPKCCHVKMLFVINLSGQPM